MTITWLLVGLIGLIVYINLGYWIYYLDAKAFWAWNKNKKVNVAAKVLLPSPTSFGISHSTWLFSFLTSRDVSAYSNFASYYDESSSPGLKWSSVAIWPIILGLMWLLAAADWVRWLLKFIFYKRLIKGFIYGVLVSGKWTKKLR